MGICTHLAIILAVALGLFLNWPQPQLPTYLLQWKNEGKTYKYRSQFDIYYRDEAGLGPADEVLLLIHGFPTSSYDWFKMWSELKGRFGRLIAPDMLGFGFSDKPVDHDYTIFEQADIIESLLSSLKVKKVHLLAHDYGDTVAQELLHRFINKKNSLYITTTCLLNGGIFPETHIPKLSQKVLLDSAVKDYLPYISNSWFFTKELASVFGDHTPPSEEDLNGWWALTRYKEGHKVLARLMQYIAQRRQNRNRWVEALQNTPTPLHFIYGPLDPINPSPMFPQHYRNLLAKATIDILSDVGHYVQWEAPAQVLNLYFKFLDQKLL